MLPFAGNNKFENSYNILFSNLVMKINKAYLFIMPRCFFIKKNRELLTSNPKKKRFVIEAHTQSLIQQTINIINTAT